VAQEVQLLGPELTFLAVDDQAKLAELMEQELEVLQVRCQVHHSLESVAGVVEPIKNSYRPNGVMRAVLAMSLACMGIWW
jgi:hypothetical protein